MSPITERAGFHVKGGVEDWKEQLKKVLQILKEQPGYLRTRWGPWSEDPQKLDLLVGWESREAHAAFSQSDAFKEAMGQFKPVLQGEPSSYFVRFVPGAPAEVVNSPIVEALSFHNCTVPEDEMRAMVEKAKALPGCNGVASGYSVDEVNGGKIFVAAIGWQSLEASKAEDTASYAAVSGSAPEVHHINFNFPVKGFRGL